MSLPIASNNVQPVQLTVFQTNDPALAGYQESPNAGPRAGQQMTSQNRRLVWKEAIRHFSPSWFTVTMGTGVAASLLNRLPYNGIWLYWLSVIVFAFNVFLFAFAVTMSLVRYSVWPEIWNVMRRDPHHSLFLGAIPIGFSTIINLFVYVCVPVWGDWADTFSWVLWIIDSSVAMAVTFFVPFTIMTSGNRKGLKAMNALQLLPLSSPLSAAASGSLVAAILPNPRYALWTIAASYGLWGIGICLSSLVLVIYYQRLTLHSLPPREVIVSVFLPMSPISVGSFGIVHLGAAAADVFPSTGFLKYDVAGEVVYVISVIVSIILWAYTLAWLAYAVGSVVYQKHFPFNMGWWGFIYPLGMLSLTTISLASELSAEFLKVLGMIFGVVTILLWIFITTGTVRGIVTGQLLYNSSVKTLETTETAIASSSGCRV